VFSRQIIIDYKEVFHTEAGRRVLADICKSAHIANSTYDQHVDPQMTFIREGERRTVLRILHTLKMKPSDIEKLLEEKEEDDDLIG
tara:strand:- start:12324 stop:12581 length:258 start_codon:yes stop_codon:yes gene_type:complete